MNTVTNFRTKDEGSPEQQKRATEIEAMAKQINERIDERSKTAAETAVAAVRADLEKRLDAMGNGLTEAQKTEMIDQVAAEVAAQIAKGRDVHTKPSFDWKDRTDGKQGKACAIEVPRVKYHVDAEAVAGGRQEALDVWVTLATGNPMRDLVTVLQFAGGTATLPAMSSIGFTEESSVPTNWPRAGSANTGALSSATLTLKNYVAETYFSQAAIDDVPGLRESVQFEMMQQWGTTEGSVIVSAMKASVTSSDAKSFAQVKTGVDNALPAKGDVLGKVADLISALDPQYLMMAEFQIGTALHAALMKETAGTNGDYAFNPDRGVREIEGYPVRLNGHIDKAAAGAVMGYFGDFRRGVILGEGQRLIIADEYGQTRPGAITFFSNGRCVSGVRDYKAVAGLIEGV